MFENTKYDSYPQNADFYYLPIEYEKTFFTKRSIYWLTDNIIERLKVILIRRSFDNRIHESNPRNSNFDELPFDGDERLITRRQIYCINDDIVFILKNGSRIDI